MLFGYRLPIITPEARRRRPRPHGALDVRLRHRLRGRVDRLHASPLFMRHAVRHRRRRGLLGRRRQRRRVRRWAWRWWSLRSPSRSPSANVGLLQLLRAKHAVRRDGGRRVRAAVGRVPAVVLLAGRHPGGRRPDHRRRAADCQIEMHRRSSTTTGSSPRVVLGAHRRRGGRRVRRSTSAGAAHARPGCPNEPAPFADLLATPACEEVCELRGRFGFMAFHGGSLEEMTDVIAAAAAERSGASYYGVHPAERPRRGTSRRTSVDPTTRRCWPTSSSTSTSSSPSTATAGTGFTPRCCSAGRTARSPTTSATHLRTHLPAYEIAHRPRRIPSELRGLHPRNPVNLPRQQGVQIELPPRVRGASPLWWDWEGPGLAPHTESLIDGLVEAAPPGRLTAAGPRVQRAAVAGFEPQGGEALDRRTAGAVGRRRRRTVAACSAGGRAGGSGGPARTRSVDGRSQPATPERRARDRRRRRRRCASMSATRCVERRRDRRAPATAATPTRRSATLRGRVAKYASLSSSGSRSTVADDPHLAVQLQPGEQQRRPRRRPSSCWLLADS